MLNILCKCKVVWMRSKGWGRILRQESYRSFYGESFKPRQREEWRAKKTNQNNHQKARASSISSIKSWEKHLKTSTIFFLCTVPFCCHLVTTIVEKNKPIKQDWLLGRWSIAAVKGEKTDNFFFPSLHNLLLKLSKMCHA